MMKLYIELWNGRHRTLHIDEDTSGRNEKVSYPPNYLRECICEKMGCSVYDVKELYFFWVEEEVDINLTTFPYIEGLGFKKNISLKSLLYRNAGGPQLKVFNLPTDIDVVMFPVSTYVDNLEEIMEKSPYMEVYFAD